MKELLNRHSTTEVPATVGVFDPRHKFVVGWDENAHVKISFIGKSFAEIFLGDMPMLEPSSSPRNIHGYSLGRTATDAEIMHRLDSSVTEHTMRTSLREVFHLMLLQRYCEEGVLANDGHWNFFYVLDLYSAPYEVAVGRSNGGWHVEADLMDSGDGWLPGSRFFTPVLI